MKLDFIMHRQYITILLFITNTNFVVLEKFNQLASARCLALCNKQFGEQRDATSWEMFDVYRPYYCVQDPTKCLACSRPCYGEHTDLKSCQNKCKESICRRSCFNIYKPRNGSDSAFKLSLTSPTVVCKYTHPLTKAAMFDQTLKHTGSSENIKTTGDDNSSLVYLRWNVVESNGIPATVPLSFIVSRQSRSETGMISDWKVVTFTNYSFLPVTGLSTASQYNFKIAAVGVDGIVDQPKETGWTAIPEARSKVDAPSGISLLKQYYTGNSVHARIKWTPGKHGGCYFKLYWMKSNSGKYKTQDVKEWSRFEFEISELDFDSEYIVEVETYDKDFLHSSKPTNITFSTLDCLNSTGHNYQICAPDELTDVNEEVGTKYKLENLEVADIKLNWTLPQYISDTNNIDHIFVTWRKEPSIALSKYITPHHGDVILENTDVNVTIKGLHWNSVYAITTQVRSSGGLSKKTINHAFLGSAYVNINPDEQTNVIGKTTPAVYTEGSDNIDTNIYFIILIPIVLVIAIIVICYVFRRRFHKRNKPNRTTRAEEVNLLYRTSSIYQIEEDDTDDYEIDIARIVMSEVVGEGAFGRVFKAVLKSSNHHATSPVKIVAVKMLRDYALPEERRNLLLEIEAMKELGQHKNLISLLACCTTGTDICLVMDYCPLGDLLNYLRSCREPTPCLAELTVSGDNKTNPKPGGSGTSSGIESGSLNSRFPYPAEKPLEAKIDPTRLLSYARQIVLGMEYLTDKKFIHRDLATRNILLYSDRVLKISDFGLTRDVYETNMYRPTSSRKLPYKWMPLETIFDQIFTMKSDVWSFGIVLWEIVTLGGCPYPGIPNEDLFKLLKDGYRMEKPQNCGDELYQMMLACWQPTPSYRPTFKQLRYNLEKLLEATQPYIDLSVVISEDYYHQDSSGSNTAVDDTTEASIEQTPSDIPNHFNFNSELYHNNNIYKPNKSLTDLPILMSLNNETNKQRYDNISKSSCELGVYGTRDSLKNTQQNLLINKQHEPSKNTMSDTHKTLQGVHGRTNDVKIKSLESFLVPKPQYTDNSVETSSNFSTSEDSGSDACSNNSTSKYSPSVFQTPSLKHGLLNQLGNFGRRRLGNSEHKHSFSLTEMSNVDCFGNSQIKMESL